MDGSDDARPAPGEELTDGPATPARPAATVIVVRGGAEQLEVLLVRRTPEARFMGGAWVFPGGAVDPGDGEGDAGLRAAAVRETAEEAGIALAGPAELVPFSRWITPAEVRIRYDTAFFLAPAPRGAEARVDRSEIVDARWSTPHDALAAAERGELLIVFPTRRHLEMIGTFPTADALLAHARGRTVEPVRPRVLGSGEAARIVLPGEPGYDD